MRQPKIPETSSDLRDLQLAALQSQLDDIKAELLGVKPRLELRCGQISGSGLRVSRVDLSLWLGARRGLTL